MREIERTTQRMRKQKRHVVRIIERVVHNERQRDQPNKENRSITEI